MNLKNEYHEYYNPAAVGNSNITGVLLYDPFVLKDRKHALMIKKYFANINLVRLPFSGHPSFSVFRQIGLVGRITRKLLLQSIDPKDIASIYRKNKLQSAYYYFNLASYCRSKHPLIAHESYKKAVSLGGLKPREAFLCAASLSDFGDPLGLDVMKNILQAGDDVQRWWSFKIRKVERALRDSVGVGAL